jgi:hypothetical protein
MAKKTPAKSKLVVRPTVAYAEAKAEPPKDEAKAEEAKSEKEGKGEVEKPLEVKAADPQAQVYQAAHDDEPIAEAAPGAAEGATAVASAVPAAAEPAAPKQPVAEGPAIDLENLPPPDAIHRLDPATPAPPPGHVPPGDSRSLRRRRGQTDEFALIYRHESHLIMRTGEVGRVGEWRDIEYPTIAAASRAYALETSRLVDEGFHDYR